MRPGYGGVGPTTLFVQTYGMSTSRWVSSSPRIWIKTFCVLRFNSRRLNHCHWTKISGMISFNIGDTLLHYLNTYHKLGDCKLWLRFTLLFKKHSKLVKVESARDYYDKLFWKHSNLRRVVLKCLQVNLWEHNLSTQVHWSKAFLLSKKFYNVKCSQTYSHMSI